jgi:hypothetical protein
MGQCAGPYRKALVQLRGQCHNVALETKEIARLLDAAPLRSHTTHIFRLVNVELTITEKQTSSCSNKDLG